LKVRIEENDRVVDENGEHVKTVLSKKFRKTFAYCYLCDKVVSSLKHYSKEH